MNAETLMELAGRVEAAIPRESTEPWIEHDGKGRPHPPRSYVEAEFRDGSTLLIGSAFISWVWDDGDEDILRWRYAPEPLSRVQAGDLLIENAAVIASALKARAQEGK